MKYIMIAIVIAMVEVKVLTDILMSTYKNWSKAASTVVKLGTNATSTEDRDLSAAISVGPDGEDRMTFLQMRTLVELEDKGMRVLDIHRFLLLGAVRIWTFANER